jgi:GMP synthase (glutamine-hydrolysing)
LISDRTTAIARRARELGVFAEIHAPTITPMEIQKLDPKGIVLSGGPASVLEAGAPGIPAAALERGVPILGVCYGMQLLAKELGGKVLPSDRREYGKATLTVIRGGTLLAGLPKESRVWASHGDFVEAMPPGFTILGTSGDGLLAAAEDPKRKIYAVQFHPEVAHTEHGTRIYKNFLFDICGFAGDWTMGQVLEEQTSRIRAQVGDRRVICGLSGGVDSSVVAALLHRAVPGQARSVFVDHGLLRRGEAAQVAESMREVIGTELVTVDARERFLGELRGIEDPETKRKTIGRVFIEVFEEAAKEWVGQLLGSDALPDGGEHVTGALGQISRPRGRAPARRNRNWESPSGVIQDRCEPSPPGLSPGSPGSPSRALGSL